MSEGFIFTSPGIKFKEIDLSNLTLSAVGITTLGLCSETISGPAFTPTFITNQTQFLNVFGPQSIAKYPLNGEYQYLLPYYANSYLNESNQLYVTRVLGLSGVNRGKGWALVLSSGVNLATTGFTGSPTTGSASFSNNTYLGVSIYSIGTAGSYFSGFTKNLGTGNFSGVLVQFTATTLSNGSGTVNTSKITITGSSFSQYENMVLGVIRSRATVTDNVNLPETVNFTTTALSMSGNTTLIGSGNMFGSFVLSASNPTTGQLTNYTVCLNPNDSHYLPNVIGSSAKDKNTMIWCEFNYPDLLNYLDNEGYGYGIVSTLVDLNSQAFTNFQQQYQGPITPWVVSQLKGSRVDELFQFISLADGNSANEQIKIAIANINPSTLTFDIYVRAFSDTDANPNYLETFTKCTLIQGTTNYIGNQIGDGGINYPQQSQYIAVNLADNIDPQDFPAGFEGYQFKNYSITGTSTTSSIAAVNPFIGYKTSYLSTDKINKVFLGISEHGYDTSNSNGTGINPDYWNYYGASGFQNSYGFHMDSGATGTYNGFQFVTGAASFRTVNDFVNPSNPYSSLSANKFVLVPAGGWDGWNENRGGRSNGDLYRPGGIYDGVSNPNSTVTDFQAWTTAINTFSNPEHVTINVFSTPGINWSDNTILVTNTIDMIETVRGDSLYIIDSPDVSIPFTVGNTGVDVLAAQNIVDLLNSTGIDSNYSCTYFPYIQIKDTQNNVNVFMPSTGEVTAAIAFTDNSTFPWFSPAGLNRGVTEALKSEYKMSEPARDILYAGRINPLRDFAGTGTAIWGQKTLQVAVSDLDRINVRRLLLQLKVLISNVSTKLLFEQDDQTTIDQFVSKLTPILNTVKRERGLNNYQLVMDSSINTPETLGRNELYGKLLLFPTPSLEFIGFSLILQPNGASFQDINGNATTGTGNS